MDYKRIRTAIVSMQHRVEDDQQSPLRFAPFCLKEDLHIHVRLIHCPKLIKADLSKKRAMFETAT
jgi:hypothetical protein